MGPVTGSGASASPLRQRADQTTFPARHPAANRTAVSPAATRTRSGSDAAAADSPARISRCAASSRLLARSPPPPPERSPPSRCQRVSTLQQAHLLGDQLMILPHRLPAVTGTARSAPGAKRSPTRPARPGARRSVVRLLVGLLLRSWYQPRRAGARLVELPLHLREVVREAATYTAGTTQVLAQLLHLVGQLPVSLTAGRRGRGEPSRAARSSRSACRSAAKRAATAASRSHLQQPGAQRVLADHRLFHPVEGLTEGADQFRRGVGCQRRPRGRPPSRANQAAVQAQRRKAMPSSDTSRVMIGQDTQFHLRAQEKP